MARVNSRLGGSSVLLLDDDPAYGYLSLISRRAPELKIVTFSESDAVARGDCPIWLGAPDKAASLLMDGEKPDWLQLTWAGFAPLMKPALPKDYLLTRAVDVFGQPMLEYVLAHILAHSKSNASYLEKQNRFIWSPVQSNSLSGRRVMIVGAGNIGQYIAKRLKCLGMDIVGVQRVPTLSGEMQATFDLSTFASHLGDVDYVVNILPDTPKTRNIFNLETFRKMKPGAMFMNIGRGTAVVDADLVQALEEGHLSSAVLDVFRQEPLPPSHQFWVTPNIVITPHIAGPIDPVSMANSFLENLDRFESRLPLNGEVDLGRGY
ncbi:D-2-hydroxyacid dehydrogenase [Pseudomonas alliivorans]|nr:D-2-hydroxyacid dehydrogenase [Pseudomonas alliivorans]